MVEKHMPLPHYVRSCLGLPLSVRGSTAHADYWGQEYNMTVISRTKLKTIALAGEEIAKSAWKVRVTP